MRLSSRLAAIAFAALLCGSLLVLPSEPATAKAERRVALVIGNGAYKVAPALPNPTRDAKAVATALRRIGFEVIDGYDLTVGEMRAKLAEFAAAMPDSKAAVVYYAGHGVSVDEENYLLPTDLALKSPTDLDLHAIGLSLVLKQMKREERVNVVILDACRDNPFAAELARTSTRAVIADRGLSRVESNLAKGTLLAFASDPKSTALDGDPGENSPFTKALLDHLEDVGVSIDTIMNRVRADVWRDTRNKQLPWVNTSIIGEFILNPQVAALQTGNAEPQGGSASTPSDGRAQETRLWDSAERSNTIEDYRAYLDAYPSGLYAPMARNRIARLSGSKASPVVSKASDSAETLKAEIGSPQTEKSLSLTLERRKDIQRRLLALDYPPGKISGVFSETTREAITDWQKRRELHPTGWLAPLQYSALLAESDVPLRRYLATNATAPKPERSTRGRSVAAAPAKAVPRPAPPRAAQPRRTYPATYSSTYPGSSPGPGYPNGHPGPYAGGRSGTDPGAAAFFGGVVGGAFGGLFRHHH